MTASTDLAPGFRMTEIGPLPEEWETAALGNPGVARLVMGQSPPSSTYNSEGIGLPFLQGKAEFGDTHPTPRRWCSSPQKTAPPNAVLMSVRAPVGDVNLAPYACCIGRGLAAILASTAVDSGFLFHQLTFAKDRIEAQGSGSIFKSITRELLARFRIALPPLGEQRRIAAVLDAVRRAIEATGKVIAATQELKRSLMQYLFTYGPVPHDQADQVPLKETEVGPMPEGWEVLTLGSVARTATGGTPSRARPEYYGGSVPWVKSGELGDAPVTRTSEYLTKEGLQNSSAKLVPAGTLLVAMYGATAGKVGILRMGAATNQAVCAIYPRADVAAAPYLFHALVRRREDLLSRRYGGAQPNLGQTVLRMFELPIPPNLAEQRLIAFNLDAADTKASSEQARRSALQSLFVTLLHDLMTGRTRVNDLELPTEEQS